MVNAPEMEIVKTSVGNVQAPEVIDPFIAMLMGQEGPPPNPRTGLVRTACQVPTIWDEEQGRSLAAGATPIGCWATAADRPKKIEAMDTTTRLNDILEPSHGKVGNIADIAVIVTPFPVEQVKARKDARCLGGHSLRGVRPSLRRR
jgi:hypothetical protein